jgi:beta-galactosidase
VELKLNGKSLGIIKAYTSNPDQARALPDGVPPAPSIPEEPGIPAGQSNDFLFTFPNVAFAAGTLEAIAYDTNGHTVASEQMHTAGPPAAIRLTSHTGPGGLHADGSDLALVDVEIVDAKGERCPTVDPFISFTLSGPAEWRGGIAQPAAGGNADTFSNYILATTLPVENGVNRVIVRSKPLSGSKLGTITLKATSHGLPPVSISLISHPVPVIDGLSTYDPATSLPSNVERGPTPAGSSIHTSRRSIVIARVTAGIHADKAMLSHDDDESTSWSNDGLISNAWIEYVFARPSAPGEMDIKLNAFRTRRYPLRVTLDGALLYEGTTPTSLGYVTIPFQQHAGHPVMGTHLRITLTGPPIDAAPAEGTAEITGKYDGAGVVPVTHDNRAILNVIEADVYEERR